MKSSSYTNPKEVVLSEAKSSKMYMSATVPSDGDIRKGLKEI